MPPKRRIPSHHRKSKPFRGSFVPARATTDNPAARVLTRYHADDAGPVLYDPAVDRPSSSLSFEGNAETILVEGAILLERDLVAEIRDEIPVEVEGHIEHRSQVVIRHDADKLARAIAELMERQLQWGYSE